MAMESHEGNFEGSSSHNSIESKSFAFSIMSKTQAGDYDGQNSVLDQAEIIGKQVLARIRLDATDPTHILYKLFDIARVSFHKIGPIYVDQLYGYRFEIPLKPNKVLAKVSPDDWTDIDEVC